MEDVTKEQLSGPKIDRRTTLKLLSAGGFTGLSVGMSGCLGDEDDTEETDDQDPADPDDRAGGQITAGVLGDTVDFLDPHLVGSSREIRVHANIFNGITKLNQDAELVGDLASDWTVPDDTTYVFEIEEGVTFHNGDPLGPEEIVWSIERLLDFEESQHRGKVENIEEMVVDDQELTIHLEEPQAPFIIFLTAAMGRSGAIVHESAEEDRDAYNEMPIGSGPFEIVDRVRGESITLEAYDDYWETDDNGNQLPYLDRIELEMVPEPSTMWSAVETGQLDFTHEITGEFGQQAQNVDGLTVDSASTGQWTAMRMITKNPADHPEYAQAATRGTIDELPDYDEIPTSDIRVRQAVAAAIDREQLVNTGFFGFALPAHQLYNPVQFMYEEEPDPGHYHNPERAEELLEEAGYADGFEAELVSLPIYERMATVIQENLSQVGIDITIDFREPSIYWGSDGIRGYDTLFGIARGSSDIDPWMSYWRQLGSNHEISGKGDSTFGDEKHNLWNNDEFDDLIIEDSVTADPERRRELLSEAMEIFIDESPFAMLVFPTPPVIRRERLQDVGIQSGVREYLHAYVTGE